MEWKETALAMGTGFFLLAAVLTLLGPVAPLEEACAFHRPDSVMGWDNPGTLATFDRFCPRCKRRWKSGDPFAFRYLARRLERALRPGVE